ncbi:MAG TPA: phosphatidate cytidylyltransferase [Myxococcales bacterium]|nr:phosphatidate cytidylyltransferase [Myxococcales bacterium]HAN32086.1 phosphatidate cytidylyltransferase [Myxococcales bacterium]
MLTRVITAVVLAPLLVALLLYGPPLWIASVVTAAGWLCARELLQMYSELRATDRHLTALLCAMITASPTLGLRFWVLTVVCSVIVVLTLSLWRLKEVELASRRAASMVLTLAYIGMFAASLVAILHSTTAQTYSGSYPFGSSALLTLFAIVFAGDTAAYFAGRFFGKTKLYPLVSPKKTVEGTVGGLIGSMLAAAACSHWLLGSAELSSWVIVALLCGAIAQVGDLVESLFKRASGTKDSGSLLPGHGGMLDRLDGVLFAAPAFWAWLQLRG